MAATRRDGFLGTKIAVEGTLDQPPDVLFVHATGFCKELWRPVVRSVIQDRSDLNHISMDLRGHGDSDRGNDGFGWDLLARDVIGVLADVESPVVGVGHSCGGAVISRAEILAPGRFSALVLIEPIVFPPPHGRFPEPLAEGAMRRRQHFATREEAIDRFGSRGFKNWTDEMLALYVDHGFVHSDDGLDLKCRPETESEVFIEGRNHDTWDHLGNIDIPVTVVTAEHSHTHQDPHLSLLVEQFNDANLITIPGATHLAPMETPTTIATIVATSLAG
jgi:pimeloyl-ACP methyl ester carboxylesterase